MRQRRHIPVGRSLLTLIVAVLTFATANRPAVAGFSAEFVNVVPEGDKFRWNYQLIFDTLPGRQRLDAGNGVLAPGVVGSQDFITIYDIGVPSEVSNVTAGAGFASQVQLVGVDAPSLLPLDQANGVNVTYRYVGPPTTVTDEKVFTGFSFLHIYDSTPIFPFLVREYSSQHTDNFGFDANRKISTLGHVVVPPPIPEPGTWLLLMVACLGLGVISIRNQSAPMMR